MISPANIAFSVPLITLIRRTSSTTIHNSSILDNRKHLSSISLDHNINNDNQVEAIPQEDQTTSQEQRTRRTRYGPRLHASSQRIVSHSRRWGSLSGILCANVPQATPREKIRRSHVSLQHRQGADGQVGNNRARIQAILPSSKCRKEEPPVPEYASSDHDGISSNKRERDNATYCNIIPPQR